MTRVLYIVNQNEGLGSIRSQVDILKKHIDKQSGYQAEIFSTKGSFFKRIWLFLNLFFLGKKYDIFHIHGCSYWGFLPIVYGVIAGSILQKRVIITYHGGDAANFLTKRTGFTRYFLKRANHLVVLSGYLETVFSSFGYFVKVIPNIIDVKKSNFNHRTLLKPRFISIRSLEPLYNIKLILEAFKIIQQKYGEASLFIIGEGSLKKPLMNYVNEKSIKNVYFEGYVSNNIIFEYMAKADIMINAPITDNMPVSLLEAFSSGVLVISSNVGGIPYMIEHQKNGLLFESGSINDLVEKIDYALENQYLSKQIVLNALNDMEKYRWENVKSSILELYS
jgi:glycosyltransferase involved in cell wall biosynthesis